MRAVVIESPFACHACRAGTCSEYFYAAEGKCDVEVEHARYLTACIRDSLKRGEAPFASHRMFTDALDDHDDAQRKQGILAGLAIGLRCDATVVYTDRGISPGMELGITASAHAGRPVEYRSLKCTECRAVAHKLSCSSKGKS